MYDKYLSKEQRDRLPFFGGPNDTVAEWDALAAQLKARMSDGTPPLEPAAQALALKWMSMMVRDTGGDAALLAGLAEMNEQEPAARANGVTPEMGAYVMQAFGAYRMQIFRKYLDDDEAAFMQANHGKRAREMPSLIARIGQQMAAGTRPDCAQAAPLAAEWMSIFESFAGTNPATHAKFRLAYANEPDLFTGTFITPDLLAWIRAAISANAAQI